MAYVDVGKNMVKWASESESEEGGGMAGEQGGADIGRRAERTQQHIR